MVFKFKIILNYFFVESDTEVSALTTTFVESSLSESVETPVESELTSVEEVFEHELIENAIATIANTPMIGFTIFFLYIIIYICFL